ncbi:hypothetical protein FSW04_19415 [Baekduia soli]|uniref:6-bladed beta-propeller n=1 Tax=Baekduia soli TaxID=496014 RepID=A0A5B8U8R3_9ACTN|nr:hypothetical protein FSW04_19415 [Baekduia soli]
MRRPLGGLEVPAEVDLDAADRVAVEAEDLGVAKPRPVVAGGLVGHEDLVVDRGEADEVEGGGGVGVGPAALEVGVAVDADVRRRREPEAGGEMALDEIALAGLEGAVAVADDREPVLRHDRSSWSSGDAGSSQHGRRGGGGLIGATGARGTLGRIQRPMDTRRDPRRVRGAPPSPSGPRARCRSCMLGPIVVVAAHRRALAALLAGVAVLAALVAVPAVAAPPALTPSVVGEPPNGDGVFRFPQAVAVSPGGGTVFVADQYSGVVQAFTADGFPRLRLGGRAARREDGRLGVVGGLAVDRSGHLYVLDAENERVQVFAADDGRHLASFGDSSVFDLVGGDPSTGAGISASGLAVAQPAAGAAPVVYVADQGHDRIERFVLDPTTLTPAGPPQLSGADVDLAAPQGVALDPAATRLYIADDDHHRVLVLDPVTLAQLGGVGTFGTGPGQFQNPYDVAVDDRSLLYVADNLTTASTSSTPAASGSWPPSDARATGPAWGTSRSCARSARWPARRAAASWRPTRPTTASRPSTRAARSPPHGGSRAAARATSRARGAWRSDPTAASRWPTASTSASRSTPPTARSPASAARSARPRASRRRAPPPASSPCPRASPTTPPATCGSPTPATTAWSSSVPTARSC